MNAYNVLTVFTLISCVNFIYVVHRFCDICECFVVLFDERKFLLAICPSSPLPLLGVPFLFVEFRIRVICVLLIDFRFRIGSMMLL